MKTMILATAAVLSLGVGSAFAGESDGQIANTFFTLLPGAVSQSAMPGAVAAGQNGASTHLYVSSHAPVTSLFAPNQNEGGNG